MGPIRMLGIRPLKVVAHAAALSGVGAVILTTLTNGFFTPIGSFDLLRFLTGLSQFPLIPIIFITFAFVSGGLFELVCAIGAVLGAFAIRRFLPRWSNGSVSRVGGVTAAIVAALLVQPAAYWSASPVDLVAGAFVFFNLVVCALLIRIELERSDPEHERRERDTAANQSALD